MNFGYTYDQQGKAWTTPYGWNYPRSYSPYDFASQYGVPDMNAWMKWQNDQSEANKQNAQRAQDVINPWMRENEETQIGAWDAIGNYYTMIGQAGSQAHLDALKRVSKPRSVATSTDYRNPYLYYGA